MKLNLLAGDKEMEESFRNEAANAAQMSESFNLTVHDVGEVTLNLGGALAKLSYHILESIDGAKDGNWVLDRLHEIGKKLPLKVVLHLACQYAKGLAAVHGKNIVHRDVKPANVLLTPSIQTAIEEWIADHDDRKLEQAVGSKTAIKVSDFGLAGIRGGNSAGANTADPAGNFKTLTSDGGLVGTPYFIPPEAYADPQRAGFPWDVYSLGLVIYMWLTGKETPLLVSKGLDQDEMFKGQWPVTFAKKLHSNRDPAISSADKALAGFREYPDVIRLMQSMTAFDPRQRPTMPQVVTELERILRDLSDDVKAKKRAEGVADVALRKADAEAKAASRERRARRAATQEAEKNRQNKRTMQGVAGVIGVTLLGILAAMPSMRKGQRLEEFGKAVAQASARVDQMLAEKNWNEAVAVLSTEIEKVKLNQDLDAKEREAYLDRLSAKLEQAKKALADRARADQLLKGAEEEVKAKRFDEARRLVEEAKKASSERGKAAEDKLRDIDRREVAEAVPLAMQHYHQGEAAGDDFSKLEALRFAGVGAEQRRDLDEMQQLLKAWNDRKKAELTTIVNQLAGVRSVPAYVKNVDGYQARAERGDRDAISVLLAIYDDLQKHVPPIVAKLLAEQSASPDTVSDELKHHPDVQAYIARNEAVRRGVIAALLQRQGEKSTVLHPQGEAAAQNFLGQELVQQLTEVQTFLGMKDYANTRAAAEALVGMAAMLLRSARQHGDLVKVTPEPDISSFVGRVNGVFLELQIKLPTGEKRALAEALERRHGNDPMVGKWLASLRN